MQSVSFSLSAGAHAAVQRTRNRRDQSKFLGVTTEQREPALRQEPQARHERRNQTATSQLHTLYTYISFIFIEIRRFILSSSLAIVYCKFFYIVVIPTNNLIRVHASS